MKYHVKNTGIRRRLWWIKNTRFYGVEQLHKHLFPAIKKTRKYEIYWSFDNSVFRINRGDSLEYFYEGENKDEALHAVKEAMK